MDRKELYRLTPRQFYNKLKGWESQKHSWYELVRLQTVELLNIQIKKEHRIRQPQRLWKFPWEKQKAKPLTSEDWNRADKLHERFERVKKRHGKKETR